MIAKIVPRPSRHGQINDVEFHVIPFAHHKGATKEDHPNPKDRDEFERPAERLHGGKGWEGFFQSEIADDARRIARSDLEQEGKENHGQQCGPRLRQ